MLKAQEKAIREKTGCQHLNGRAIEHPVLGGRDASRDKVKAK